MYRDASKDAGEVDHEDYALTRELVEKYATKDGFIMVTFANSHYLDFGENGALYSQQASVIRPSLSVAVHQMISHLHRWEHTRRRCDNCFRTAVLNWVEHLDAVGVKEYVVGAMDTDLLSELVARGINCFSMDTGLTKNDFGWGSASFHRMGREKVQLVEIFTRMGFNMLISDVDTVWLRDFREFLPVCPECDLLASSDCLTTTTKVFTRLCT